MDSYVHASPCRDERKFPTNTVCSVHVQWIENDGSLWVLLSPEVKTMEYVSQYLADCANFDGLNSMAVGDVVCAFDSHYGSWYRAKILETEPLTIKFIDYGNVTKVTPEFVAALPPDLSFIHQLAIHVKLAPESNIMPSIGDELLVNYVTSENGIAVVSVEVPMETQAPVEVNLALPSDKDNRYAVPKVVVTHHVSDTLLDVTMPTVSSEQGTSDTGFDLDGESTDNIFESSDNYSSERIASVPSVAKSSDNYSSERIASVPSVAKSSDNYSSERIASVPSVATDRSSAKSRESITELVTADVCTSMQSELPDSNIPVDKVLILQGRSSTVVEPEESVSVDTTLLTAPGVGEATTVLSVDTTLLTAPGVGEATTALSVDKTLLTAPGVGEATTALSVDTTLLTAPGVGEATTALSGKATMPTISIEEVIPPVPIEMVADAGFDLKSESKDTILKSNDSTDTIAYVPRVVTTDTGSVKSREVVADLVTVDVHNSLHPELPGSNAPPVDALGLLGDSSPAVMSEESAPVEATSTTIPIAQEILAIDFSVKATLPNSNSHEQISALPKNEVFNNLCHDSLETVSAAPPTVTTEIVSGSSVEGFTDVVSHASEKVFKPLEGVTSGPRNKSTTQTIADTSMTLNELSSTPTVTQSDSGLNASAKAFSMSGSPSSLNGQSFMAHRPLSDNPKRKKETKKEKAEFSHHFELSIIQEQVRIQMLQLQKKVEQDVAYQMNSFKQEMSRQMSSVGHQLATLFADVALMKNDIQMGRYSERSPPMNPAQHQNSNLSGNEQPFQHTTAGHSNGHQLYGYETAGKHRGMDCSSPYSHSAPSEQQSFSTNNRAKLDTRAPSASSKVETPGSKFLFVGKISQEVTLDHLFNLFSLYGNVQKMKKMSPVCAVIEMSDPAQAALAVRFLNFAPLKGSKLHVALSKFSSLFTNRQDFESGLAKDFSKSRLHRFKAGSREWNADKLDPPCNRLRVSVLKSILDDKIKEIFKSKGHDVLITSKPGRISDTKTLYITLSSTEEAIDALCELHSTEYADWSCLHITFARPSNF